MRLKKILKNIQYKEIRGPRDIEISGICSDSRLVVPNNLFIARKGSTFDASEFIYDAIDAGAVAIVTDIYDPFLKITQVIIEDVALAEAGIALNFYENPSRDLFSIAITGTNGKTSTNYLIKYLLDQNGRPSGLMGTIEYILKNVSIPSKLTTPDCISIQKYLREMANSGLKYVCMEASSHGLSQNRLKNIDFDIAIFTNLSLDHLDYHHSFENYKNSKKMLFDALSEKAHAIVNMDDETSKDIIKDTRAKVFTYSINKKADLSVADVRYTLKGTFFKVLHKDKKVDFFTHLIGRHNLYNLLCAIAASLVLKIDLEKIAEDIKNFKNIKGRLEKVDNCKNLNIYVDFAHTPEALENVLSIFNNFKKGRIINVFGCGGNRDRSKRPLMAKISEKLADVSIVTNDNPRTEDPDSIVQEIIKGFSNNNFIIEKDRKKAIEKAIRLASIDDIVIITGKGHENYQIFKNVTVEFDDCKTAKEICSIT